MKSTRKKIAVVGAGVTGLNAAAMLASWGHDVTLLESMDRVGGVAASTEEGGVRFTPGPQYAWGWEPGGPAWDAAPTLDLKMRAMPEEFEQLRIRDEPYRPVRRAMPDALRDLDPGDLERALRLARLLDEAGQAGATLGADASFRLGGPSMLAKLVTARVPWRARALAMSLRNLSVLDLAKRHEVSPRALRLLTFSQGIFAEDLQTLSALLFASARHHLKGPLFVPKGGFASLIDALERGALRAGVEIQTNARVESATRSAKGATTLTTQSIARTYDHVLWACSPGVVLEMLTQEARSARAKNRLERAFSRANSICGVNLIVELSAQDQARLRHRNFTWFQDDGDIAFSSTRRRPARTLNFCSPTLNANQAGPRHAICAFSHAGAQDVEAALLAELRRLHVTPRVLERRAMTPEVWTRVFGAHRGAVYGRRLTARSLQSSPWRCAPRGWSIAHSGAGISGLLGCLQLANAVARDIEGSV